MSEPMLAMRTAQFWSKPGVFEHLNVGVWLREFLEALDRSMPGGLPVSGDRDPKAHAIVMVDGKFCLLGETTFELADEDFNKAPWQVVNEIKALRKIAIAPPIEIIPGQGEVEVEAICGHRAGQRVCALEPGHKENHTDGEVRWPNEA